MRYVILTTPRTGSNVLCEMLASTGVAGMRDVNDAGFFIGYGEGLRQAYEEGAAEQYFARNRTANGVEGCKIGWDYIEHLNTHLPFGAVDQILGSFDRFIILTRQDVVAQAVSRLIARLSGEWTSEDQPAAPEPVVYDRERIGYFIAQTRASHTFFEAWLAEHSIEPLRLIYEVNSDDWRRAVRHVLSFIEVPFSAKGRIETPTLQRQVDVRKAQYIERYYAETRQSVREGVAHA